MRRNSNDSYDSEEPESESEDGYEEDIQIFDYNYIYNLKIIIRILELEGFTILIMKKNKRKMTILKERMKEEN